MERKLKGKKMKRKKNEKESHFLSLVWFREKTQGKKITFYQIFFPLFGLEKMNKAKKNISCKIKM